ncbi:ribonuclease HI [Trypanosoma cruzi]|nr:ribonuclease HI [Trypanosoma cruzi]
MEALKRRASPRASHRGGAAALPPTRHPPLYCLSGFTQLFCSPATLRDPACSGTSGRRPTPCADAVRRLRPRQRYVQRPQCVSPSFPCKRQNRCQLEWALIQFLMAIRHVCPFQKDAGT